MQFRKIIKAISSTRKNETQTDSNCTENDSQDNQYETTICNTVIEYLKNLNKTKQFLIFHQKQNCLVALYYQIKISCDGFPKNLNYNAIDSLLM